MSEIEVADVVHSGPSRPKPNEKVRDWYKKNYPKDRDGNIIYDKWTFGNTISLLCLGVDINPLFGGNTLVRERIFVGVSLLYCISNEQIYELWTKSSGSRPPTTDIVG